MTAKEFLNQAYRVERILNAKLEQLRAYKDLSAKATSTLSLTPSSGTSNIHRMEEVIVKMIDLENELISDMSCLLDYRAEIVKTIKAVDSRDYRALLELRYLCYMPWDEIAAEMRYSTQRIFQLHNEALKDISVSGED